jgi:hypothetical protein
MRFYTTEQLGPERSLTPEGFLLCKNVPIARTGSQIYAHGEIPVEPDSNGLIHIDRPESEVFRNETLASFNGKPVVDEHPPEGRVTPDLWRQKAVGVLINPRRGDGLNFDNAFMYADMLIQDQGAIEAVLNGKREVSAGYDSEYLQLAPGHGQQRNIVGNHVALVDRGRCGPRCAIGDALPMANRVQAMQNRIRRAVRTKDEAGVLNAVAELSRDPDLMGEVLSGDDYPAVGGESPQHHVTINVHGGKASDDSDDPPSAAAVPPDDDTPAAGGGGDRLAALEARIDQIEQVLAMLADEGGGDDDDTEQAQQPAPTAEGGEGGKKPDSDEGTGDRRSTIDRRAMVGDSTSLREGFHRVLSQAEILMPGIKLMTFDAAAKPGVTLDAMCDFRRKTLEASRHTPAGNSALESVMEGRLPRSFHDKSMTCDSVSLVFNAAASLLASQNRGRATQPHFAPDGKRNGFSTGAPSPAAINEANRKAFAQ